MEPMDDGWRPELNALIASARNAREAGALLKELLTPAEYDELAMRWQIIRGLIEGETQRAVRDELETSIATVTRGARELKYGNGAFKKFYTRLYGRVSSLAGPTSQ